MNPLRLLPWIIAVVLCLSVVAPAAYAHSHTCDLAADGPIQAPEVDPMIFRDGDRTISITLADAFDFHGHECPGMTIAYLALQYGLDILYGEQAPDRSDIMVSCRIPARGPIDMIDLVMKGDDRGSRTWAPVGMKKSPAGFRFTIFRKSTCQAVDVQLKPDQFPSDFFQLKKKDKKGTITSKECDCLADYTRRIITVFPTMSLETLFGRPQPYKVIWWGVLEPGEMDRNIRELRRKHKHKKQ